jgi:TRAP-type C4-dicarboxylate transport system permease small subunit
VLAAYQSPERQRPGSRLVAPASASAAARDELIIAIIPWVAMSGLFLAVRRRNVIRIDFFVDKFWPGPRKVLRLAGDLLSAIVFAYLAWV